MADVVGCGEYPYVERLMGSNIIGYLNIMIVTTFPKLNVTPHTLRIPTCISLDFKRSDLDLAHLIDGHKKVGGDIHSLQGPLDGDSISRLQI